MSDDLSATVDDRYRKRHSDDCDRSLTLAEAAISAEGFETPIHFACFIDHNTTATDATFACLDLT